jgi:hypothetical protein
MRWAILVLVMVAILPATGCMDLLDDPAPAPPPAQPQPPVDAFRNQTLQVTYNIHFNYTPKDETGARSMTPEVINDRLNVDGKDDGNTFVVADGVTPQFIVNINVNNDGQDHLTAYADVFGLGRSGDLFQANSGQAAFVDPVNMMNTLSDNIYSWIHQGWHYN